MSTSAMPLGDCHLHSGLMCWFDDPVSGLHPVFRIRPGPDGGEGDAMSASVEVGADQSGLTQNEQLVHVRLTVNSPVGAVWRALVSAEGTALWLGEGAVLGDKGQSYHCADGSAGVVRSFHPLEQLRLSWHADADSEPSLIEVDVTPEEDRTRLRLWHDGVPAERRAQMRDRWQQALEALAATV
jgi:uncharacterized protein YndB with AHSA1/START domain